MAPTYQQLLQQLHALPASATQVEGFLRLFFQEAQIGSDEWDAAFRTLTAASLTAGQITATTLVAQSISANSLQLNLTAGISVAKGQFAWNADEATADLGLDGGVVLQIGLETLYHVQNDTGATLTDGQAVMFEEAVGNSGRGRVVLMDASDTANVSLYIGVVTDEILDGATGKVTEFGRVRGVNASGTGTGKLCFGTETWLNGQSLYFDPDAAHQGFFTNVPPSSPNVKVRAAFVLSNHAVTGTIFVRTSRFDETTAWGDRAGGNYSEFEADGSFTPHGTATFPSVVCLDYTNSVAARDAEENIHGDLHLVASGHDLSAGALTLTAGTDFGVGKLVIVINAGSDFDGTIEVLGTQVDRDTGARTTSQTDIISIDTLTTDTSTPDDGNGVLIHNLVNAYMTADWYTAESANIVISSANTTITDIDVYHCSFEQFNDAQEITITTVDTNLFALAAAGTMSLYMYTVEVTGDKVDIVPFISFMVDNTYFAAEEYYREPRRGNLGKVISGATDGVFISAKFGGINKFADINIKVWATVITPMP